MHAQLRGTTTTTATKHVYENSRNKETIYDHKLPTVPFIAACASDSFPRKLLTGICFVLRVATSPRDTTRKKERKTPAAGQSQTLTCSRRLLAIKSQHCATSAAESCGDECLSIPASSPLKAPRIRQRKRGPLLSLPLLAACVSLCLSIPPLPLCAQL